MELKQRIEEIIVTDKLVNLPASKVIDAILSAIGNCGECEFVSFCSVRKSRGKVMAEIHKDNGFSCTDFERRRDNG